MNFVDYLIATKNYSTLNVVNEYTKQFALNQTSINALNFRKSRLNGATNPGDVNKNIKRDDINRQMMQMNEYRTHNPNDIMGYGNTAKELYNNRKQNIADIQQFRQDKARELWNNRNNWFHRTGITPSEAAWNAGKENYNSNARYPGEL